MRRTSADWTGLISGTYTSPWENDDTDLLMTHVPINIRESESHEQTM